MKRILLVSVLTVLAAAPAFTQESVRIYTNPELPSREILNRLNLKLAWAKRLPMDGRRDGIESVQLLARDDREQLLVQTLRGLVILLDATTGDALWRTYVGFPYQNAQPAGFNDDSIFCTRQEQAFVLDRATGRQRLYSVDKKGHVTFGMNLGSAPTAAPVADNDAVFFVRDIKVTGYLLPRYGILDKVRPGAAPEGNLPVPAAVIARSSAQPEFLWNSVTYSIPLLSPALLGRETLVVTGTDGTFISFNKFKGAENFRFKFRGTVTAAMGQYGETAYIGSEDSTLYALDMDKGKLLWRFLAGGPIRLQPWVTAQDVFVSADRAGLFRVDRASGEQVWRNAQAVQFLAANQKFVYAADRFGNFLVLDYLRGTQLAAYQAGAYNVYFGNELTDRAYLAAHDGTLICLHHRDNAVPFRVRPLPKKVIPKKDEPKKEDDKGAQQGAMDIPPHFAPFRDGVPALSAVRRTAWFPEPRLMRRREHAGLGEGV